MPEGAAGEAGATGKQTGAGAEAEAEAEAEASCAAAAFCERVWPPRLPTSAAQSP